MSKLILEFDNDLVRDEFLGQLSDGGIEDTINDCMMESKGISISLDYKKAFKEWGWDGKGDPTVIISNQG